MSKSATASVDLRPVITNPGEWKFDHFHPREVSCWCCGDFKIDPTLGEVLEALRLVSHNKPIKVLSGYRCGKRNKAVGGVLNSYHTQGRAVDFTLLKAPGAKLGLWMKMVVAWLEGEGQEMGIRGIGLYPYRGFIHMDTRPKPARWSEIRGVEGKLIQVTGLDAGLKGITLAFGV